MYIKIEALKGGVGMNQDNEKKRVGEQRAEDVIEKIEKCRRIKKKVVFEIIHGEHIITLLQINRFGKSLKFLRRKKLTCKFKSI